MGDRIKDILLKVTEWIMILMMYIALPACALTVIAAMTILVFAFIKYMLGF